MLGVSCPNLSSTKPQNLWHTLMMTYGEWFFYNILMYCILSVGFMTAQSGDKLMKLADFTFTKEINDGDRCYWSCYTHNNNGCPAKVYTERNKIVYAKNMHNHPPTEFFV